MPCALFFLSLLLHNLLIPFEVLSQKKSRCKCIQDDIWKGVVSGLVFMYLCLEMGVEECQQERKAECRGINKLEIQEKERIKTNLLF